MSLLETLKNIPAFQHVPEEQLNWLIDKSELIHYEKGHQLISPGDPIVDLLVLLTGKYSMKLQKNNQLVPMSERVAPAIAGTLPYSRTTVAKGFIIMEEDADVLTLHKSHFREMIVDCHELTTVMVHEMNTRIRSFTKSEQLDDKMLSLGKLSAGLAHELNNPASAVVRSSLALSAEIKGMPEKFKRMLKIRLDDDKINQVNDLLFSKTKEGVQQYSMIERSSREDELIDWLYDIGAENPEDMVENFVDYGFDVDDMDELMEGIGEDDQVSVFDWLNQVMNTERLVDEISDASERISNLVTSIKSYTHMDQAQERVPTDIHAGIDNTVTILKHKIKQNSIEYIRRFDEALPNVEILPSAMNQVWTNLIDNAIDAMDSADERKLTIETASSRNAVYVKIHDTGHGIPTEIKDRIFDPFFTTKPIGKGTGLGLENVLQIIRIQHNGSISVESEPGNTLFTISIPLKHE